MSELSVKERVKLFLKQEHLTINRICGEDTALQKKMSRQVNQQVTSMTLDVLLYILEYFPHLSAEWLLRGIVPMDKNEREEDNIEGVDTKLCESDKIKYLEAIITEKERLIQVLLKTKD